MDIEALNRREFIMLVPLAVSGLAVVLARAEAPTQGPHQASDRGAMAEPPFHSPSSERSGEDRPRSEAEGAAPEKPEKIVKLKLAEDEWRKRLTPEQFSVLRKEDTERAWTSPLNHEKRNGTYVCAGCGLELFTSDMKFDSGTGWPSFTTHLPGRLESKKDFKMILPRTEYHCAKCGGHHGHVFNDGPPPTGERWCNNGVALKFVPAPEEKPTQGSQQASDRRPRSEAEGGT